MRNLRFIIGIALLLGTCQTYAEQPEQSDMKTTTANEPQPTAQQEKIKQIRCPFQRFVRKMIKLSNDKIKPCLKTVEKMLASLLQTVYHLTPTIYKPITKHEMRDDYVNNLVDSITPEIMREMTHIVIEEARNVHVTRQPSQPQSQKPDEQTQKILISFAGVAQHFFKILQDPENADNVAPNLIGMLAGMVNIGTEAMQRGAFDVDADLQDLKAYAEQLDDEIKYAMLFIITNTQ